jgi:hypothetical protein
MAGDRGARRQACVDKARFELASLEERGVVLVGNAFSQVLLVKGDLGEGELGAGLLGGRDGVALKAALSRLGFAPEDFAVLSAIGADSAPLAGPLAREAVLCADPATLVLLDETAANVAREAFAAELATVEGFECAMLMPGRVAHVLGMRAMNLGGFEAALDDPQEKQVMWARLKQLGPLGEPY